MLWHSCWWSLLNIHMSWPNCSRTTWHRGDRIGTVEGHWQPPLADGCCGHMGMGMSCTSWGLGIDEMGETSETGEPPEGEEEVVIVSTLPVLHVLHCRLSLLFNLPLRLCKCDLHLSLAKPCCSQTCIMKKDQYIHDVAHSSSRTVNLQHVWVGEHRLTQG